MDELNLTIEEISQKVDEATTITDDGKTYINPRKVHGFKNALLAHFSAAPAYSQNQFRDEFGVDVRRCTTVGALRATMNKKLNVLGISLGPNNLYADAKRTIRAEIFDESMSRFANFTSAFFFYMKNTQSEVIRVFINGRFYYILLGK